jgi:hypothetical protein
MQSKVEERSSLAASSTRTAAILAAVICVGTAIFQVALAAGVPWGEAAWGGGEAELSAAERTGSAFAIFIWLGAAMVVLGRAGFWRAGPRTGVLLGLGTWFLAAATGIGAVLNFASQSRWENFVFGPLALLLAVLCAIVARGDAQG